MSVTGNKQRDYWLSKLQIPRENAPSALIIYGTRYLSENLNRLASNFPRVEHITGRGKFLDDLFVTNISGHSVAIATAYGAPMAAELVHVFCEIGVDVIIHTGSCGSLTSDLELGSILSVSEAWSGEGVSQYYCPSQQSFKSSIPRKTLDRSLKTDQLQVKTGSIFTTSASLMESDEITNVWRSKGCIAVDMECASVFSICHHYQVDCSAFLWVSDLVHGQGGAPTLAIDNYRMSFLKNWLLARSISIVCDMVTNRSNLHG